jgi:glucosyl-3-phosphoglycerate synthase
MIARRPSRLEATRAGGTIGTVSPSAERADVHERAARWYRERTTTWRDWPLDSLLAAKLRHGCSISLVIPARDEADTLPPIVTLLRESLMKEAPLLDEIVVIDSDSSDATAEVAANAGATVYRAREIAAEFGARQGKGEALWKSLFVASGDLLVFVDGDLTAWGPHFVTGLLGPLLSDSDVHLVRADYARLRTHADGTVTADGGRLTELVARPLIGLHWPELAGVAQPLAGEWAIRRRLMESLAIPVGYGVELSTLIDTVARNGLDAVAQVKLGERAHRHRSDSDMALAAAELLAVAESRRTQVDLAALGPIELPRFASGHGTPNARRVTLSERPPFASLGDEVA